MGKVYSLGALQDLQTLDTPATEEERANYIRGRIMQAAEAATEIGVDDDEPTTPTERIMIVLIWSWSAAMTVIVLASIWASFS